MYPNMTPYVQNPPYAGGDILAQNAQLFAQVDILQKERLALGEQLQSASAIIEMIKLKLPAPETCTYLTHRAGREEGMVLVKQKLGHPLERIVEVSQAFFERATFVLADSGDFYIAIEVAFKNSDRKEFIYLHRTEVENPKKLFQTLGVYGIYINLSRKTSEKAELVLAYIYRIANGLCKMDRELGWSGPPWEYFIAEKMPWWSIKRSLTEERTAISAREIAFLKKTYGMCNPESREMVLLPYLAMLEPVLEEHGCGRNFLINMVVEELTPEVLRKLQKILGATRTFKIPVRLKSLNELLKNSTERCLIFRMNRSQISTEDQKLLAKNLAVLRELSAREPLPVLISQMPLFSDAAEMLHIEKTQFPFFCDFAMLRREFESYLFDNASIVAKKIKSAQIPEGLGAFSSEFARFHVAEEIFLDFFQHLTGENVRGNGREWLEDFFRRKFEESDRSGMAEEFAFCLQKAVECQAVAVIDPYTEMRDNSVIVTDQEIYFDKAVLTLIAKTYFYGYSEYSLLQALKEAGVLKADIGNKINYKIKRPCTLDGELRWKRMIVLKKEELIPEGAYDFLEI